MKENSLQRSLGKLLFMLMHCNIDLYSHRIYTYDAISPNAIQIGNMVEAQVGFCVVQINKGRYLMLHKLRSICVLSREVEEVSLL